MTKVCKICGENLDISNFSKNKTYKDGLHYYCKTCCKKKYYYKRLQKKENLDFRYNKELAEFYKSEKYKILQRKAWDQVMIEARAGKLKKQKVCMICKKKSDKIEAHHENYRNPLELIWLCTFCHTELHQIKFTYEKKGFSLSLKIIN